MSRNGTGDKHRHGNTQQGQRIMHRFSEKGNLFVYPHIKKMGYEITFKGTCPEPAADICKFLIYIHIVK